MVEPMLSSPGEAEATRRIDDAIRANAIHLDLSFLELAELPDSLQQLTRLTWLDLGGNQLRILPEWLGQLTNLTWLSLGDNQLTVLPDSLSRLIDLTWLSLGGNQFRVLPEWLGQFAKLTTFHLGGNQLTVLPEWLCQLNTLAELGLSDNQLSVLPDSVGLLTSLTWLHLGGNQLKILPDSLSRLTNLTWLSLGGNQLRVLPNWLGQLPNLKEVDLYHNSLVTPPPEVVAHGSGAVLTFLRAGARVGTGRQWRAKLLVVGQGGVGKTSLVKAVMGLPHDAMEPTTHGLRIEEITLGHPEEPEQQMRLSVWDFGGQDIYHATHQFFLSAGCLSILVWDSRAGWEQCKVEYWLDLLDARAPGTPILLVATHSADRPPDLPLDAWRQKYPQIAGNLPVECPERSGIDEVYAELASLATSLEGMGAPWPSSWLAAIEACRALPSTHVDVRELHKTLLDAGISEPAERDTLAKVMHRLGDILYYPDEQRLADTVILRPQWLSARIAAILDSEPVAQRRGLVIREDIEREWSDVERSIREYLLDLMDRFNISYRVSGTKDDAVAIVVDRLPWNPPAYDNMWNSAGGRADLPEMRMRYRLGTSLPPGIPTWFIALEHRFTTGKVWRTGALLRHDDGQHLGLITADQRTGIVDLAVRGPWPGSFLWLLDSGLNLTFSRYPGRKIDREIPCPCRRGTKEICSTWFDYGDLTRRLQAGVPTVECPQTYARVDITTLLSGIAPAVRDSTSSPNEYVLDLLATLNANVGRILAAVKEGSRVTTGELARQSAAMDVGFTRMWNLLDAQYQTRCPRVFTLTPARTSWQPGYQRFVLRLYCEEPGAWHPLPGDEGTYAVTRVDPWLAALNRHLTRVLALLTAAAPLVGPILGVSAHYLQGQLANDVEGMKELLASLPTRLPLPEDQVNQVASNSGNDWSKPSIRAENDADFRAIADFLHQIDQHDKWGGLSRVTTPEGRVLYLCRDHLERYQLIPSL